MFKFLFILFASLFCNQAFSSSKEDIISKMKLTNNLSFNFMQIIKNKKQNGIFIIQYPKKIFCEYNDYKKKIIVSNGKSLVIKNRYNGSYYIYALKKTPLEFLLDKKYLISKIDVLEARVVDNKYLNFKILKTIMKLIFFLIKKL